MRIEAITEGNMNNYLRKAYPSNFVRSFLYQLLITAAAVKYKDQKKMGQEEKTLLDLLTSIELAIAIQIKFDKPESNITLKLTTDRLLKEKVSELQQDIDTIKETLRNRLGAAKNEQEAARLQDDEKEILSLSVQRALERKVAPLCPEYRAQICRLTAQVSRKNSKRNTFISSVKKIWDETHNINTLTGEISAMMNQLLTAESNAELHKGVTGFLQQQIVDLDEKVDDVDNQNKELRATVTTIEDKYEKAEDARCDLNATLSELQLEFIRATAAQANSRQNISSLSNNHQVSMLNNSVFAPNAKTQCLAATKDLKEILSEERSKCAFEICRQISRHTETDKPQFYELLESLLRVSNTEDNGNDIILDFLSENEHLTKKTKNSIEKYRALEPNNIPIAQQKKYYKAVCTMYKYGGFYTLAALTPDMDRFHTFLELRKNLKNTCKNNLQGNSVFKNSNNSHNTATTATTTTTTTTATTN